MTDPSPLHALFLSSTKHGLRPLQAARAALGSLPMVARALLLRAKKPMRIVVDARATTGSTDCTTHVRLPRLPLPEDDEDVQAVLDLCGLTYGLLHHEVGHCNHSDFALFQTARRGLEQTLLNIIEDVRMENAHIRDFPASRRYLDAMNYVMHTQGRWAVVPDGMAPPQVFTNYVLTRVNALFRTDPLSNRVLDEYRALMEVAFSPEFTQKLDGLLDETATLLTCRDSFDLARKVVDLLQQERDAAKQPSPDVPSEAEPDSSPQDAKESAKDEPGNADTPSDAADDADPSKGDASDDADTDTGDGAADDASEPNGPDQPTSSASGEDSSDDASEPSGPSDRPADESSDPGSTDDGSTGDAPDDTSDATNGSPGSASSSTDEPPSDSDGAGAGEASTGNATSPAGDSTSDATSDPASSTGPGSTCNAPPPADTHLADALDQVLSNNDNAPPTDRHENVRQMLQELADDLAQVLHEALDLEQAMQELEEGRGLAGSESSSGQLRLGSNHDLDRGHSVALDIRRKLLSELDAITNADVFIGRRGSRLSGRHLPRVMSGDPRVFRSKTEGLAPSTAVMLCQDVSTSMQGMPIQIASQALYASALALEGIEGVDVAAMAFPGNGKIIGFGESPKFRQERFQLSAWGGTPMAEAVLVATQALLEQRNTRRLMLVLTDGYPAEPELTRTHIATAEAEGIEVFGVGICTESVQHYFKRWITIDDVSQLPARLVALVRDEVMLSIAA